MPTHLSLDDHLAGLASSGVALRDAAAKAGPDAPVPTCPDWDVTALVTHQGMVHRWAAANLRGESDHDTDASVAAAGEAAERGATELLSWYSDGLAALIDTVRATPADSTARVFLKDAPPPRRFWARRQCHETLIHGVDALSAELGRFPTAAEAGVDPRLAADGIDELLTGFITRGQGRLHAAEPYTILVRTTDTGHSWTVRVSDGPVVSAPGETASPEVVFSGTGAQLYLSLWNRADEITADGRPDVVDQWRAQIRVSWS